MRWLFLLATVVACTLATEPREASAAASYYLDSTNGNDSWSGTLAQPNAGLTDGPWRTIGRANALFDVTTTSAGDTLNLRRGRVWSGTTLTVSRSGNSGSYVTVRDYGAGALPVLSGADECLVIKASYVQVIGVATNSCFSGSSAGNSGVRIDGDHNVLSAGVSSGNKMGMYIKDGADYNRVTGYTISNNQRVELADIDSNGIGVNLHGSNTEIDHNVFQGNYWVSDAGCRGGSAIEVYGDDNGSASDNNIHHNLAIDNKTFSELGHSSQNGVANGNSYSYNIIRGSLPPTQCVGSGSSCTVGGVSEQRGLSALVTRGEGEAYGPVYGTKFQNNTVYLSGACSHGVVCSACGPNILIVRNTISVAVWKGAYFGGSMPDVDYSDFVHTGADGFHCQGPSGSCGPLAHGLPHGTDPVFLDAGAGDFRLLPCSSPAIDAGTVLSGQTADSVGAAVPQDGDSNASAIADIRAYETPAGSCAGDADTDGFTDARETFMGTDPADRCADTTTANDESAPGVSPGPTDINDTRLTSLEDVLLFTTHFNTTNGGSNPPGKTYDARFDLNASNQVTIGDVLVYIPFFNKSCVP